MNLFAMIDKIFLNMKNVEIALIT